MNVTREKIWRIILGAVCISLVFVLASCDDDDNVQADNMIDRNEAFEEFNTVTFFDDRDMNKDAGFDNDEFNQSFFDSFDLNNNDFIEENELNMSRQNFRINATTNFNDLDANTDARLEMAEFRSDFEANNFFNDFDADVNASLTSREFSDGVFTRFDDDNDGLIEKDVFQTRFDSHFRGK